MSKIIDKINNKRVYIKIIVLWNNLITKINKKRA